MSEPGALEHRPGGGGRPAGGDARVFRARLILGLLLAGFLFLLAIDTPPWNAAVRARLHSGARLRPIDYRHLTAWWLAAANTLAVAGLLASVRRWIGTAEVTPCPALTPRRTASARVFAGLLAGAVLVAAWLAYPRLSFGMWEDELDSVRLYIDGAYHRDPSGEMRFHHVRWRDTLWNDVQANNHVPFSIASRLSLGTWRVLARPKTRIVSESAVRLPAYLAGLAGLVVIAAFARRLRFPMAGIVAAWILALHPWYLRYTSEARGYAWLLLGVPATWLLLVRALERGSWGRWLAYGAAQCVVLWTNVGMVYQLLLTNAVALAALWRLQRGSGFSQQAARLVVVNVLGAVAFAQLMGPNLPQIAHYLDSWRGRAGPADLSEVASYFLAGIQWSTHDPHYLNLARIKAALPALYWGALVTMGAALCGGALRMLRGGGVTALFVPAFLVPAPLLYTVSWLRDDRLYPWYLLFALPGLALLVGVAGEALVAAARRRWPVALLMAVAVAGMLSWVALTWVPRRELRLIPLDRTRDSVLRIRQRLGPVAPGRERVLTASFHHPPSYYDPEVQVVRHGPELLALMEESDARGLPLFVNNGRPAAARARHPGLARLVECEALFEKFATLYAFEDTGERDVYRYRSGSAGRADSCPAPGRHPKQRHRQPRRRIRRLRRFR